MLHSLLETVPDHLHKSMKAYLSQVAFMPGTVCFFLFNHLDKQLYCYPNPHTHLYQHLNKTGKYGLLALTKQLSSGSVGTFLSHQRKVNLNSREWQNEGMKGFIVVQDLKIKTKNNRSIRLLSRHKAITYKQGCPEWSVGYCTDISQLKINGEASLAVFYKGDRLPLKKQLNEGKLTLFTQREMEVLRLLSKGYKSIDIEKILQISLHTVRTHRRNLLKKTKLKSTTQLVNFALQEGILHADL